MTLLTGATLPGRSHRATGRNNQDGLALLRRPGVAVAVVTDGCSAGPCSEVGARAGARVIARALAALAPAHPPGDALAAALGEALGAWLQAQLQGVAPADHAEELASLWLFGFLAAVVTPRRVAVLGLGDGLFHVDGHTTCLDPGPDNAPPYAAYALLEGTLPQPALHLDLPAPGPELLILATDGLLPAADALPGLAGDPGVMDHPFAAQRALRCLAEQRRLQDDCTLALCRPGAP